MARPSFGELLATYRGAAGLTQEELAARAGLSPDAVGLLERGARTAPRDRTIALLATALGLSQAERGDFAAAARRRHDGRTIEVPSDLRMWSSTFVGRGRELTEVRALLARPDVRLVTLTGPPGAGKTRLALEAARDLAADNRDGVLVVALGALRDACLVPQAIREAMRLRARDGESALDAVVAHCRARRQVLILDNFEQVLAAGPELVELLARCPELRLLVTSRATLRVRPEHELQVLPLPLPDPGTGFAELCEVASVALFVERARAAVPAFQLRAENAGAVADVCRRLDGLPLALELAAPWLRLLTAEQLLQRLDRRLELLVEGPFDLPERQRTLRAALDWSCELLAPAQLALLRRLSVFAGGAPLDGVERVCQAAEPLPGGLLRQLAALVDHSLVRRQDAAGGEPCVVLLESIREYARELLDASGELEATASAHLARYVELAERGGDEIRGSGQEPWLERLRGEHDNLRAALAWALEGGETEAGLRLAGALWQFWDFGGYRSEGLDWLERLLAAPGPARPAVRAQALHAAGRLAEEVGSPDASIVRHEESLAIYRELGDRRGAAAALRGIALAVGGQGGHDRAISLLQEAVGVLRELDDPALLASAIMNLGCSVSLHGDPQRATPLFEEALALRRGIGDALGTALCLINLGERAAADGDFAGARSRLDEAVAIARRLRSPYHLAAALLNLADLARLRGDAADAAVHCRESLTLFGGIGERGGVAVCLRLLGWVAATGGRWAGAARLFGAADALRPVAIAPDRAVEASYARVCAELAERLGGDEYASAFEAGGRLSMEAAVAEAGRRPERLNISPGRTA